MSETTDEPTMPLDEFCRTVSLTDRRVELRERDELTLHVVRAGDRSRGRGRRGADVGERRVHEIGAQRDLHVRQTTQRSPAAQDGVSKVFPGFRPGLNEPNARRDFSDASRGRARS